MTANIDADVVKNILIAAVERETGKQVTDITINIDKDKLIGVQVKFDPESNKPVFKPTKEFIPMNFGEFV